MRCHYSKYDRTDKEDNLAREGFNHCVHIEGEYAEITQAIQWCVTHCRGKFRQIRGSTQIDTVSTSWAYLSFELAEDVMLFRLQVE